MFCPEFSELCRMYRKVAGLHPAAPMDNLNAIESNTCASAYRTCPFSVETIDRVPRDGVGAEPIADQD